MSRSTNSTPWIVYVLFLLIGILLAWSFWPTRGVDVADDPAAKSRPIAPAGAFTNEEQTRINIFEKTKTSVVNISSAQVVRNRFNLNVQQVPKGSGTGFIWDEKGRVVTNYHVVEGANHIRVTLDDQTTWTVHRVNFDADRDIAVLWTDIPEGKRIPIPIGESSKLQVGRTAFAIGNPFGLDHSLSSGIISALGREMKTDDGRVLHGLIQTDAAINPGNSGGPLLDAAGRLIGVNTAIISASGGSHGIGFAIPVDLVNDVVPRLISGVKESRPSLGIIAAPEQWAKQRGISGVLVINVIPEGPAERANLRPTRRDDNGRIILGDIIVGIDTHKIRSVNEMTSLLADNYRVGQEVSVRVLRDSEIVEVPLTLSADVR
jgi:S1-C subfamily serine protease